MNRQYGFDPLPIQRRSLYSSRQQHAEQLHALDTSLYTHRASHVDPAASSSALSAPFSPSFPSPSPPPWSDSSHSAMAAMCYNPRQWSHSGPVSGSYMPFSHSPESRSQELTGMEASMPSPPPPYAPITLEDVPRRARASPRLDSSASTPSPSTHSRPFSGAGSSRSSLRNAAATQYPPPPPLPTTRVRDRIHQRLDRENRRHFFSLSNLASRQQPAERQDHFEDLNVQPLPATDQSVQPPAARRAASAGAITQLSTSQHLARHDAEFGNERPAWQEGMPIPGPPGPPPSARSQSLNRTVPRLSGSSSSSGSTVTGSSIARPKMMDLLLSAVPPTPADWTDDDAAIAATTVPGNAHHAHSAQYQEYQPRKSTLVRRPAHRDPSAEGIRERRSRSRAHWEGHNDVGPSANVSDASGGLYGDPSPGPVDLVLANPSTFIRKMQQREDETQSQPRSTHRAPAEGWQATRVGTLPILTPPYTPATDVIGALQQKVLQSPPQTLTTPSSARNDASRTTPRNNTHRPTLPPVQTSPVKEHTFSSASLERYRGFIHQESNVRSDEERLRLFAKFVVDESRIRRDRFAAAYAQVAVDLFDLTRHMWRPLSPSGKQKGPSNESATPASDVARTQSPDVAVPSSGSSFANYTPATDTESSCYAAEQHEWSDKFQPRLSPIASLALSTAADETSSRGRSASRWFEGSVEGSTGRGGGTLARSPREAKYMSLHPSELQSVVTPTSTLSTPTPCATAHPLPRDFQEKVPDKSWIEKGAPGPSSASSPRSSQDLDRFQSLALPRSPPLNISRLVTLPPSYPRHYPAVNNTHPVLEDIRKRQRKLVDFSCIRSLTERHAADKRDKAQASASAIQERKRELRTRLASEIGRGTMSYAAAGRAEALFDEEEAERLSTEAQDAHSRLQTMVSEPGRRQLEGRIQASDACINTMLTALSSTELSGNSNPGAHVEGDEEPELLEHLTLLKWLFEGREHIYKEIFDLQLLETKACRSVSRFHNAAQSESDLQFENDLFAEDLQNMQREFAEQAHLRFAELREAVERQVSRGVERQISAFWDIAPALVEVVQSVPQHDLLGFEVIVPAAEYEENPAYRDYSLQYLYTILSHVQKSTYQFIEAQVNLLCLLHEVQTAAMAASARMIEIQRAMAGSSGDGERSSRDGGGLEAEMTQVRAEEEAMLTADLKDKVGEVERQWDEALGKALVECKERVRGALMECGGWDDGLED